MAMGTRAKGFNFMDTEPALDLSLDTVQSSEGASNGTSHSSIVEMNSDSNDGKLVMEHGNKNDNSRQVNVSPGVMKKIKQIYMQDVPMHLSGLSLSGSGMELYVKIDETVDKVLKDAEEPRKKQSVIVNKRRTKAKNKRLKSLIQVSRNKGVQQPFTEQIECTDGTIRQTKEKKLKDYQRGGGDQKMSDKIMNTRMSFGCVPSFQPSSGMGNTVNEGPSTSSMQGNIPLDYTMTNNPFAGGFNSQSLPLKRRHSPQRWQNCYRTKEDEGTFYENGQVKNYNISKHINARGGYSQPTTSQASMPPQTSSEMSLAQSSVGPNFQIDLLKPQTMDADTLIKFTEYTHAIRKDLKQKYKDLSKLVKSFEQTVQERNGPALKDDDQTQETQNKQCRIM